MVYLKKDELKTLYTESKSQARIWRKDYSGYERLAENGLMEGLDPNLPEVNDGSLSAALFKLPKRIVSSKLSGKVKAIDRDEAWLSELANIQWHNEIIPNANSQAPFIRKWKDAVRKSAIYGSVPLITLFVDRGNDDRGADFIVGQPQDVTLEPGKVSDYDSDVLFWDVYYTRLQLKNMIAEAKKDKKEAEENKHDDYNKWDIPALQKVLDSKEDEGTDPLDTPKQINDNATVKKKGFKFCVVVQRGVNAPFYMYHKGTDVTVREWTNPDPTGDIPIHFLYCYQDFINPYGIGIAKLAGGTQNVLDYMRQADVLATQLGLEPPLDIQGNADEVDLESLVYTRKALWFSGNAKVVQVKMSNEVYQQLPERTAMYKTALNQLIPLGDTSIAAGSGDPQYSKTPAGIKFQAASLSIDDEDYKDNLYITYEAVARSMINTHFANMNGSDLMRLDDDQREILIKAGMEFPATADGEMSNQIDIVWDTVRAKFDFEVDPEVDKAKDDSQKLEGLMKVAELTASDPMLEQDLAQVNMKLNKGELFAEIIKLTSDSDKIVTDIGPDEQTMEQQDPTMGLNSQSDQSMQPQVDPNQPTQPVQPNQASQGQPSQAEIDANVQAVMTQYGVNEQIALEALAAEHAGTPIETIIPVLKQFGGTA